MQTPNQAPVNSEHVPIVLFDGQILDGRNRYLAARKAGQGVPAVEYLLANPEAAVFSLNDMRRHMPTGARALSAAESVTTERGANQHVQNCTSSSDAAENFGVSRRTVETAKPVAEHGSVELKQAVRSGDVPIHVAADLGLSRTAIHEARKVRDAEEADPGVVRRKLDQRLESPRHCARSPCPNWAMKSTSSGDFS